MSPYHFFNHFINIFLQFRGLPTPFEFFKIFDENSFKNQHTCGYTVYFYLFVNLTWIFILKD